MAVILDKNFDIDKLKKLPWLRYVKGVEYETLV